MNSYNIKFLKKFKKPHGKVKLAGIGINATINKEGISRLNDKGFALKTLEYGKLTSNEIESARRAIRKVTKKFGKVLIRVYPYLPLTKKPAEVRMGKGKGSKVRAWVSPVKPGKTLFEVFGVS